MFFGEVGIVHFLGGKGFVADFLILGIVECKIIRNSNFHRAKFGAIVARGARNFDKGVQGFDGFFNSGLFLLI